MKLKYLAALLMLLALGCAGEGSSTPATDGGTAPAAATPDADATSSAATVSDEALTKVSLTVTGMR
jgi:hypothetical protein